MAVAIAIGATLMVPQSDAAEDAAKSEAAPAGAPSEAPATEAAAPSEAATPAAPASGEKMMPIDRVKTTPVGQLKNPYTDNPEAIAEGKKYYLGNSCNGCHGGGGGGGMCPPLTNETWVYGSDDDTLYRLIILGSKELQATGRSRIAKETVQGPMPPYAEIITDEDVLWKIIAYVRSVYGGRAVKRNW